MKKYSSYLLALGLTAGLFLTSCKKENTSGTDDTNATELQAQSDDQSQVSSDMDDVTNDVDASIENDGGSYTGKPIGLPLPNLKCDFSVAFDTASTANPKTITITYAANGTCTTLRNTRSGKVVISFSDGFRWGNPGAYFTVNYQDLKITRKRDSKSITLNGTVTHTNVSGGLLRNLANATTPIVHELKSSNMSITFNNGATRTWSIAKRRTFTYDGGIVVSVSGIRTETDGVAEWGANRFGNNFTTTIISPLVIKQTWDFRLASGKVKHEVGARSVTATFGLDANGVALAAYQALLYMKVEWVGANSQAGTAILLY